MHHLAVLKTQKGEGVGAASIALHLEVFVLPRAL